MTITTINLIFGSSYNPNNGNRNITITGSSSYSISETTIDQTSFPITFAIYNSTAEQVTVNIDYLSGLLHTDYNITINGVPPSSDYTGNGNNVTIDADATYNVGLSLYDNSTYFNGTSLVTLYNDNTEASLQYTFTGIIIQNIRVFVDSSPIMNTPNKGWICAGSINNNGVARDESIYKSDITFNNCAIHNTSGETTTIGNGNGSCSGGICGGNNMDVALTFTNCYLIANRLYISRTEGFAYNGGICGGNNAGSVLNFINCRAQSASILYIDKSAPNINSTNSSGGICGGHNSLTDGTFMKCRVESYDRLYIDDSGSGSDGGICGGRNVGNFTFIDCSVYSTNSLQIDTAGGGNDGGICGGGNNSGGSTIDSYSFIFTNCSINSNSGLIINTNTNSGNGAIGGYNGGICGGSNTSLITNSQSFTFTNCSVSSNVNISITEPSPTVGENTYTTDTNYLQDGGICGGGNNNTSSAAGTYTFNSCSLTSSGGLISISKSQCNANSGGICGGANNLYPTEGSDEGRFIFNYCSILASTYVYINTSGAINSSTDEFDYTSYPSGTNTYIEIGVGDILSDFGFLYADSPDKPLLVEYGGSCLLIVDSPLNMFPQITDETINTKYAGQNLSALNLTGLDLSYYNLTNTILNGNYLPSGASNYSNTIITDSAAIATNIAKNFTGTVASTTILDRPSMNAGGMSALLHGLFNTNQNSSGMTLFVSSLFSSFLLREERYVTMFNVPAISIPALSPWNGVISSAATVNLISASQTPIVNLTTLTKNRYYYILLQNYPDTVTITNGNDTPLVVEALPSINGLPYTTFFQYYTSDPDNLTAISSGSSLTINNNTFYVHSLAFEATDTACYLKGTKILTKTGYKYIEELSVDDTIVTKGKIHKNSHILKDKFKLEKIVSIVHFKLNYSSVETAPIIIKQNALGFNYPNEDLFVSPNHGIIVKNKLIAARNLLNGKTIYQDFDSTEMPFIYYHLKLENHSAIIANGLLSESYLKSN